MSLHWQKVVFYADCDDDGNCPYCRIDYAECECPGPSQDDEYEYRFETDGTMRARRIDSTATALIAYAKSIGFDYVPINDMIDGLLVLGQTVIIVDWKSQGGDLTPSQSRLIARGVPVRFIQRPDQLDALKVELLRSL